MALINSKKAFILGHPVQHSRSPVIHKFWLQKFNLEGDYIPLDLPKEELHDFLKGFHEKGFAGGNVTMPYKEAVFKYVQDFGKPTSQAQRIGAVNTLFYDGENLIGDNTDCYGFIKNLDDHLPVNWEKAITNIVIIGAGGAARAVLIGLLDKYAGQSLHITLINRTPQRARNLASLAPEYCSVAEWNDIEQKFIDADLIINTTSLGMDEKNFQMPFSFQKAKKTVWVNDIIYVPLMTPFLLAAQKEGLRTIDGLGMLLHQAVPGFHHWFGIRPQVTSQLRDLLLKDLDHKG